MTTPWDPWIQAYVDFTNAIAQGRLEYLSMYVADSFVAVINGTEFDLSAFKNEIGRQRLAFSDFGQNIDLHETYPENNTLLVSYDMYITFDGRLYNAAGQFQEPNGNRVKITSTERYYFDALNKITRVDMNANPDMTWNQLS